MICFLSGISCSCWAQVKFLGEHLLQTSNQHVHCKYEFKYIFEVWVSFHSPGLQNCLCDCLSLPGMEYNHCIFHRIPTKPHIPWKQGDFHHWPTHCLTPDQRGCPLKVQFNAHQVNPNIQYVPWKLQDGSYALNTCLHLNLWSWKHSPEAWKEELGKYFEAADNVHPNQHFVCLVVLKILRLLLKLQRVNVYVQEANRKLRRDQVKRMGQFLSRHKTWELCWVPWRYTQARKSPCCFLVFNLKKTPVCENTSHPLLDIYRSLVTDSSGARSSSNSF